MNEQVGEHRLTVEESPAREDVEAVSDGLEAYNRARTGRDDARQLAIFVRDDTGQVIGGLCGWTFWDWLAIDLLWVDESLRGQGYGSALLLAAEREAVARGCRRALLQTMSFQAPEFYRKHGYEEFGTLDGFAGRHSRHELTKALG